MWTTLHSSLLFAVMCMATLVTARSPPGSNSGAAHTHPQWATVTVRLILLTIFVFPLKTIAFLLVLVCFYLFCTVSLLFPATLRARIMPPVGRVVSRASLCALGFLHIRWIRSQEAPDPPFAVVVANHSSTVDILLCMSHYFPSFLAKSAVASYPLIGPIAKCMNCVFVDIKAKAASDQGQGTSCHVKQRVQDVMKEGSTLMPMCVFPEGTTRCVVCFAGGEMFTVSTATAST